MSKNKYCGNCYYFSNEDIGGEGLCGYPLSPFVTLCGKKGCKHHTFRKPANNGWTEITPDNVDEVYRIDQNRLVVQYANNNYPITRMCRDFSAALSTMAKIGGYYYFVLPELEIKEEQS